MGTLDSVLGKFFFTTKTRAVDPDPHSFSVLDLDPISLSVLDPDPGGKN